MLGVVVFTIVIGVAITQLKRETAFNPTEQYDVWHDRAAFHFLIEENEIGRYLETVQAQVTPGGHFILGTFSERGPSKCSGIPIKPYSEGEMIAMR
jgi:hypothetical protein